MAQITFKGSSVQTNGSLPKIGQQAPEFTLVKSDLSNLSGSDLKGKRVILNIFPSLDTAVCAMSVRKFNQMAAKLDNTVTLAVSMDLPFAQGRFCSTEGINNVIPASAFRSSFGKDFGLMMTDGPLAGLFARSVVVLDAEGKVAYEELVTEVTHEPNYDAVLTFLGK